MPKRGSRQNRSVSEVMADYRHDEATRKNNPPAKIAAEGAVPPLPKIEYSYSPRLSPVLRFDPTGEPDKLPLLLEQARNRPLTGDELRILSDALRKEEPWLEWTGKREQNSFTVDPVALHIHERVSAQAILRIAARQDIQRDLFADPQQQYHEAVQFYEHDIDWANRLILGDSLQVMASLAKREDLAGKVQMIYIDPPYGIKFASNFQPEVDQQNVKETEAYLTREPEMVKAYRDTWHLGVHSYLTYLRDRLISARDLLADSGSIFVQISDENLHLVRDLMDEVFGRSNFVSQITFVKTGGFSSSALKGVADYILWYCRNPDSMLVNGLYELRSEEGTRYSRIQLRSGRRGPEGEFTPTELVDGFRRFADDNPTSQANPLHEIEFEGTSFKQPWKTNPAGLWRLREAGRLMRQKSKLRYVRFFDDFQATQYTNVWTDIGGIQSRTDKKVYVVQTAPEAIKRCMLLTTTPGDLVLDPTCGGGTTARVAEEWGRRWITIDTSRVAISVARQRLLTAKFEYFEFKNNGTGMKDGFTYKAVPHVTLKSIAQNSNLDPIFAKHEPVLNAKLEACNAALKKISGELRRKLAAKLVAKQKEHGKRSITEADRRRWELPGTWELWEVPFDTDPDWPNDLRDSVNGYLKAWRAKTDDVDECIRANAEQEELIDQPIKTPGVVRVSGPFTVEAVQPPEMSLTDPTLMEFDGAPEALDTFDERGAQLPPVKMSFVVPQVEMDLKNVEAYLDQMMRLLKNDGVRFPNNAQMKFSRLDRIWGTDSGLHAAGRWHSDGETDDDVEGRAFVAVGFGPQYGPVTAKQVEQLIREANRRSFDDLVIAGFSFDGPAQAVIEEAQHPELRIHMANIRPDVNPGMEGLLKEQPGSELFTVFGQPRTSIDGPDAEGHYTVTMQGVDIYNPVENSITPTGSDKVAAWFIDSDYDGWTFCITQAFFPDKGAWDNLARALNGPGGVIDAEAFAALSGTASLPFPVGENRTVAVKVIDPRGNEVMKVHRLA